MQVSQETTKPSGFDWIGNIPNSWAVDRIKDVIPAIYGGGTPDNSHPEYWEDGNITWITPTDFQDFKDSDVISNSRRKITSEGLEASAATLLPEGSVVMASRATIGVAKIAGVQLCTNQGFVSFVCERILNKFLRYAIEDYLGDMFANIASGTTFREISRSEVRRTHFAFPSFEEQRRIAAYLDEACTAIDGAIRSKRQQLEVLDDLRKSIIYKAITRGLSERVELCDSGVEWVRKKPLHWQTCRIKDVCDFFNTARIPLSAEERGQMVEKVYDYYGASGVIDKVEGYLFDGTYILIAEDGANLLRRSSPLAFIASGKFWVNNHAHILRPRFGDIGYFVHLLENLDYSLYVTGSAQPKLTKENLGKFKIIVPSISEQKQISVFLQGRAEQIQTLKNNLDNQIIVLEKYRRSLIHGCVTGKRGIE
jgi:type I restriction enzyme S subunit